MGAASGMGQVDGTVADPLRGKAGVRMADIDVGQGSFVADTAAGGQTVMVWVVGRSVGEAVGLGWLE